jgi:hypothetical protein
MTKQLVTKDQLARLFAEWGITEPIPGKGKMVVISRPLQPAVRVVKTTHKATYGGELWEIGPLVQPEP